MRNCVHCGFCLATCPTYQLLGDELDSPRGRIYLIKQVVEGQTPTRLTQLHLDRCLTCRSCETTCPSGVEYGELVEIGRRIVEARVPRTSGQSALRWLLREGLTSAFFGPAVRVGTALRGLLPATLQSKLPRAGSGGGKAGIKRDTERDTERNAKPGTKPGPDRHTGRHAIGDAIDGWPVRVHARKVLLLAGCVQPSLAPNINPASARVLDAAGIQTVVAPAAGCCGAIRAHLADHEGALQDMRNNIDAWLPYLDGASPVEAIVMNASGCGVTVKEYGKSLAHDPAYAQKARRISESTRDLGEFVAGLVPVLRPLLAQSGDALAVHLPCTLQHGQKLGSSIEPLLGALGFRVLGPPDEAHLCCGSAGTYSVLEPALALQLRDRKLGNLHALGAPRIVSANIGCIQHLQAGTKVPVSHWIEAVDQALAR